MAEEMSDDLYSDGGNTAVAEETESETTKETDSESVAESGESGSPGLLSKGFFQGKDLKPGTICKIKIEKLTDGQALVSYVPHESEDEDEVEVKETSEVDELMA